MEVGEAVSCVYRYPDDLTDQPIAFDGTVLSISRGEYIDEAAAAPVDILIQVNEVFREDLDETVTMHTFDFSAPDPGPPGRPLTGDAGGEVHGPRPEQSRSRASTCILSLT